LPSIKAKKIEENNGLCGVLGKSASSFSFGVFVA
jgi:hypothetical protein